VLSSGRSEKGYPLHSDRFWLLLCLVLWLIAIPGLPGSLAASGAWNADGRSDRMPIDWDAAYFSVIEAPNLERLARGEIITEIARVDEQTVVAQSIGRIKARPQVCFDLVRRYDQYMAIMPHTVESKVIRAFALDAPYPGAEAVDFWTRISVFGFSTGYLLRIVHLVDPEAERLDIYWTLVDDPAQSTDCLDAKQRPCANDLAVNKGSHRFEPFPGAPEHTLHTYTLTLSGTRWYQQAALRFGAQQSVCDVVTSIRETLNCTE
jgi:hypothetical protein